MLGAANNQRWTINGANDGTVVDAETEVTVTFTNFGNLLGAGGNDRFVFDNGGSIGGEIDGGAGDDTIDYDTNGISGVTVTLRDTILNIETLVGDGTTLIGNSAGNTVWNLTTSGGGSVNEGITEIAFSNVTTIRNGGNLNTYTSNGSYSGVINLTLDNNTWNHTAGAKLTTGSLTGEGA